MRNSTGLLRVESQGLSRQFLKPFSAVYPDPYSNFLRSEILGTGYTLLWGYFNFPFNSKFGVIFTPSVELK